MIDLDKVREGLVAMRADLDAHDRVTQEDRAPVELDQTSVGRLSRMDALQVQAMSLAGEQRRRNERVRIDAALRRLDSGDYGDCVMCGEEIAPERLDLDPTIATCIRCASRGSGKP